MSGKSLGRFCSGEQMCALLEALLTGNEDWREGDGDGDGARPFRTGGEVNPSSRMSSSCTSRRALFVGHTTSIAFWTTVRKVDMCCGSSTRASSPRTLLNSSSTSTCSASCNGVMPAMIVRVRIDIAAYGNDCTEGSRGVSAQQHLSIGQSVGGTERRGSVMWGMRANLHHDAHPGLIQGMFPMLSNRPLR
jgi:hypothetical protein